MKQVKSKKRMIILFLLVVAVSAYAQVPALASAHDEMTAPVGTMVYVVGEVDVHRSGKLLDWDLVDIGLEIEDYDLVQTGDTGSVEISLLTPSTRDMTITVVENTAFYVDVAKLDGKKKTYVELLSGSIGLKVQKLAGDTSVAVRTPGIVMGVRGTEFNVTVAPDGSYLITCREGEVLCEDASGSKRYALAGQVVEKTDESFRAVSVPVTEIGRYTTDWSAERERIFRTGASTFIRAFSRQYRRYEPGFIEALSGLLEQKVVFDTWAKAYTSGEQIPTDKLMLQRARVTPAIVAVRSVLPVYEQLFYRLKTMERYHSRGIGRTTIDRGITSTAFFNGFRQNEGKIEQGLALVRYYLKLYARMSGYEDSSILEDIFSGNPLKGSGPPAPTDPHSF